MEKLKCDYPGCKKIIEGYSISHVEHLMKQHKIKHENDEKKLNQEVKHGRKKIKPGGKTWKKKN
jgi:hypothetical protein